jgi:putative sugar O-methyltransferase
MESKNLEIFLNFLDSPRKVLLKMRNLKTRLSSARPTASDSEKTYYAQFVKAAIEDESQFHKFRKNYAYRQILEHVTYTQGVEYLETLALYGESSPGKFQNFVRDSRGIGSPREYEYTNYGLVSPTILRYLAIAAEINYIFDFESPITLAEIGIGYGGQFAALQQLLDISNYLTFDLPQVQKLTQKFLVAIGTREETCKIQSQDILSVTETKCDLLVSNYAFSELPREIQLDYLQKVLKNSSCGYMIMNSGLLNKTGRTNGKLSLKEILKSLPHAEVFDEIPKTGPDNYLLIWGHSRQPLSRMSVLSTSHDNLDWDS